MAVIKFKAFKNYILNEMNNLCFEMIWLYNTIYSFPFIVHDL